MRLTRSYLRVVGAIALAGGCAATAIGGAPADPFLQSSAYTPAGVDQQAIRLSQYVAVDSGIPAATQMLPPDQELADVVLTDGYGSLNQAYSGYDGYGGYSGGNYTWQLLPQGLIYRSYLAGPREPRISTTVLSMSGSQERSQTIWDATVGGRRGLLRYGDNDPLHPQGMQIDIEGAALVRLNLDEERDVEASDFRFGVPVTFGSGPVQLKTGYYHLSSHLGDEFKVRNPGATRINYVRDSLMLGLSYFPTPDWRLYGEADYAVFFTAGGAEPWEFQFGLEYSHGGPTGFNGTPFFATNVHLREELDFGGDWTTQLGWLWRNCEGNTLRLGLHYMNGKSTQYQFFTESEEQIGFGIWYDF